VLQCGACRHVCMQSDTAMCYSVARAGTYACSRTRLCVTVSRVPARMHAVGHGCVLQCGACRHECMQSDEAVCYNVACLGTYACSRT
jgi:hypothetical protein